MSLIHETDFGTPRSKSRTMVTLTIDGESVTVPEGTSIMRAAMEAGTQIPKLCATDMVDAFGSCRLCLVEIEGRAGTPDLGARRHLDHACGDGGRHANSKALRDRHGGCIRLVPALPGRNRRPRGNARSRCPKAPRSCVRRWRPARKFQSSARPTWWMHSARAGSAWSKSKAARERPLPAPRRSCRASWSTPRPNG